MMKIINKPRGSGKTVRLLYESERTGYPILVINETVRSDLKYKASLMGIKISEVYTVKDLVSRKLLSKDFKYILVDELPIITHQIVEELCGAYIETATMSEEFDNSSNK